MTNLPQVNSQIINGNLKNCHQNTKQSVSNESAGAKQHELNDKKLQRIEKYLNEQNNLYLALKKDFQQLKQTNKKLNLQLREKDRQIQKHQINQKGFISDALFTRQKLRKGQNFQVESDDLKKTNSFLKAQVQKLELEARLLIEKIQKQVRQIDQIKTFGEEANRNYQAENYGLKRIIQSLLAKVEKQNRQIDELKRLAKETNRKQQLQNSQSQFYLEEKSILYQGT